MLPLWNNSCGRNFRHWGPVATSENMQRKLLVVSGIQCIMYTCAICCRFLPFFYNNLFFKTTLQTVTTQSYFTRFHDFWCISFSTRLQIMEDEGTCGGRLLLHHLEGWSRGFVLLILYRIPSGRCLWCKVADDEVLRGRGVSLVIDRAKWLIIQFRMSFTFSIPSLQILTTENTQYNMHLRL